MANKDRKIVNIKNFRKGGTSQYFGVVAEVWHFGKDDSLVGVAYNDFLESEGHLISDVVIERAGRHELKTGDEIAFYRTPEPEELFTTNEQGHKISIGGMAFHRITKIAFIP